MNEVEQYVSDKQQAISLSESAMQHVLAYLNKQEGSKGLRLSLKKTGCSGLSYVVDYVMAEQADDLVFPLHESYHLYIEKGSYPFLRGMVIDYVKQGLNAKFIFSNPNQTGQCGCGESFTVS